jgi:hypothetical protein
MLTRSFVLAVLVSLALGAPSSATEPGTPMDCSDLELAPGLTCTTLIPAPSSTLYRGGPVGTRGAVDNEGNIYVGGVENSALQQIGMCLGQPLFRRPLLRVLNGSTWETLITAQDRCSTFPQRREGVSTVGLHFDARGSLYAEFASSCAFGAGGPQLACAQYIPGEDLSNNVWIARIDGFTPLADVLPPPPLPEPLCSNGEDDDGDGRIDAADDHCKSAADNDESRP